jgi:hypothetical protein
MMIITVKGCPSGHMKQLFITKKDGSAKEYPVRFNSADNNDRGLRYMS